MPLTTKVRSRSYDKCYVWMLKFPLEIRWFHVTWKYGNFLGMRKISFCLRPFPGKWCKSFTFIGTIISFSQPSPQLEPSNSNKYLYEHLKKECKLLIQWGPFQNSKFESFQRIHNQEFDSIFETVIWKRSQREQSYDSIWHYQGKQSFTQCF